MPEGQKLGDGNNGSLLIGDKGVLTTGTYSERTRLLPDERMVDFQPPPQLLTRSPGHYQDWIRACKGGEPACASFDYSGPFTEWVLLGTIAQRFEGKLLWDGANLRFTNRPEANQYLTRAVPPRLGATRGLTNMPRKHVTGRQPRPWRGSSAPAIRCQRP